MISLITVSCLDPEHHHTTNAMFDCLYDGLFMKVVSFPPHEVRLKPARKLSFYLVPPQSFFPKVLGLMKTFFFLSKLCPVFF